MRPYAITLVTAAWSATRTMTVLQKDEFLGNDRSVRLL